MGLIACVAYSLFYTSLLIAERMPLERFFNGGMSPGIDDWLRCGLYVLSLSPITHLYATNVPIATIRFWPNDYSYRLAPIRDVDCSALGHNQTKQRLFEETEDAAIPQLQAAPNKALAEEYIRLLPLFKSIDYMASLIALSLNIILCTCCVRIAAKCAEEAITLVGIPCRPNFARSCFKRYRCNLIVDT